MATELIETTGMVLSASPIKEYDKRIELLTKEYGRISAFATGARKVNSPLSACTVPFTFGIFRLYEGRTSYTVHSAQIKTYFSEIAEDYDILCYASYFAELARYYTRENLDASGELLLLYVSCSAMLKRQVPLSLTRIIYEMRMMQTAGEGLELFRCLSCGRQEEAMRVYLSRGGMLCDACFDKLPDYQKEAGILLSKDALHALQYVITTPLTKLYTFQVSKEVEQELHNFMEKYLNHYIHFHFKSLELLELSAERL